MTYAFAAAGTGGHVFPAIAVADALVERGATADQIVLLRWRPHGGGSGACRRVPLRPGRDARAAPVAVEGEPRVARDGVEGGESDDRGDARRRDPGGCRLRRIRLRSGRHRRRSGEGDPARPRAERRPRVWPTGSSRGGLPPPSSPFLPQHARCATPSWWATRCGADLARFDRGRRRPEARRHYDLPSDVTVLGVVGGSLGAQVINDVVARIADDADADQLAIVHLAGPSHHEAVSARAARYAGSCGALLPSRRTWRASTPPSTWCCARSGALTVGELAATGTPAVLVPLEAVGQEGNADHLAGAVAPWSSPSWRSTGFRWWCSRSSSTRNGAR